jgi:hypothetical protein
MLLDRDEARAIEALNPFIAHSKHHVHAIKQAVVTWLELTVFASKLSRIMNLANKILLEGVSSSSSQEVSSLEVELIRELKTVRVWDSFSHPRWLAFEVDCGIQIRPEQFEVAHKVIEGNGDIFQVI